MKVFRTGEKTLVVQLGTKISEETYKRVQEFNHLFQNDLHLGIDEIVPSYQSVTIFFNSEIKDEAAYVAYIRKKWESANIRHAEYEPRTWDIPVCYEEAFALDHNLVQQHTGLTMKEIIEIHTSVTYKVYFLGFLPGFPYLGGMDKRLQTPRLSTPRRKLEEGSVGIGDAQTGIYPLESPGGWNIIGRTPFRIYDPQKEHPFLFQAGDLLRFYPITRKEYATIKEEKE